MCQWALAFLFPSSLSGVFPWRWCFFGPGSSYSPSSSLWLLADIKRFIGGGVGSDRYLWDAWAVFVFLLDFVWEIPMGELEFVSFFPRIDQSIICGVFSVYLPTRLAIIGIGNGGARGFVGCVRWVCGGRAVPQRSCLNCETLGFGGRARLLRLFSHIMIHYPRLLLSLLFPLGCMVAC
jgi:hypothetical protein